MCRSSVFGLRPDDARPHPRERPSLLRLAHALALGLVLSAFAATSATAATVTIQPAAGDARTFATSAGGWTNAIDYNGLVCIPGVTCPSATGSFVVTGGAGGAGDGFLRTSFGTLLGVLSTTTSTWTSPAFTAPAETDQASLSVDVRANIASLLAIGSVRMTGTLVDTTRPSSTPLATIPLTSSPSFTTATMAVPPGALTPGDSYQLRLATALTTTVSAVTSGTVDYDDVALRLTDLTPPSGLTATVSGSGAPQVTGSVDPNGQATSVSVQYGTTTAYDSSSGPVSAAGSGSQPFSIPLGNLTPGSTYHYQVTATSTDGSATTTDATFVAPTPPTDAVPFVAGAGNARTRTVTFDRPNTVTDAHVEVRDAGGGLISSTDDTDADGQVTITLPDADASYGVDVVRENAAAQSTTSAIVPVTLDRVGPSTTGVGLAVVPTLSSDRARTATFTVPVDAVAARAQVVTSPGGTAVGVPVEAVGGSATVQLGVTDGAYAVQLTLLDAAGNATTVTSGVVTLDSSAPSAGGAPVVTGAGNSRTRTATFDRDPSTVDATVQVLDGTGTVVASTDVPIGASGSVTLPDADGDYWIRVEQTDAASNDAFTAATPVTLDRAAPAAGPAPTVTGAESVRARTVAFTRAPDAASATVEVTPSGGGTTVSTVVASGGSASVTLPDADGDYLVDVVQTDAAGNAATSPAATVTLDRVAPDAGGAPNVTGAPDALTVTFDRAPDATGARIEVLDGNGAVVATVPVPTGATATVDLPDAAGSYGIRVVQTDAAGNSATSPATPVTRAAIDGGPTGPTGGGGTTPVPAPTTPTTTPTAPAATPTPTPTPTPATPVTPPTAQPELSDPAGLGTLLSACYGSGAVAVTNAGVHGTRATVTGLSRYATGTAIALMDNHGRQVASATVSTRGTFAATFAAPAKKLQAHTLYHAVVGTVASAWLRLVRANAITSVTVHGRVVTIHGVVDPKHLGAKVRFQVRGGHGAVGCSTTAGILPIARRGATYNHRTGAYVLRVPLPAGSGRLALRTRASGRAVSNSSAVIR